MTELVIDASIAIKWVVKEQGTSEALALRRNRLFVPEGERSIVPPRCGARFGAKPLPPDYKSRVILLTAAGTE